MAAPDEIVHQPVRLRILAALNGRDGAALDFITLKAITESTNGNLGAHLATLETAGYVRVLKDHVGKKSRTRALITPRGRQAYLAHVAFLRSVLDS